MSYELNTAVPCIAFNDNMPQRVVTLDTGEHIALWHATERGHGNVLALRVQAWAVHADGKPVEVDDEDGVVLVQTVHSTNAQELVSVGLPALVQALHDVLLGEPTEVLQLPEQFRDGLSIRNALVIASAMGAM